MAQTDYELGATAATTKLNALSTPVNPPKGTFNEWTVTNVKGDALTVGHGFPAATWTFDWLNQAMVDQLRTFCAGVASKIAYIVTRRNDGTFVKYSCIMHWPAPIAGNYAGIGNDGTAIYQDVTITFSKLVAV